MLQLVFSAPELSCSRPFFGGWGRFPKLCLYYTTFWTKGQPKSNQNLIFFWTISCGGYQVGA
ncbi:uncharacterized protein METZ01_LOCUS104542 [marine metagenome]|uniref:Uncharacterized protein n=1 Tax=marine metagenome TaxID=408172 RepID=A0A381WHU9_9ZZZZ